MTSPHAPVLLAEVIEALAPPSGDVIIDATFGAGGYTRAMLDRGAENVIAIDRDPEALARAGVPEKQRRMRMRQIDDPLLADRMDEGTPSYRQASRWGGILPAVWSFMLALRERGLGSAWTSLHLQNEREVAELLLQRGLPESRLSACAL